MGIDTAYREAERKIEEAGRSGGYAGSALPRRPQSTILFLSNMSLTELPESIGSLTRLEMLYLNNNKLTEVPSSLGNLSQLQELVLHSNKLTEVPKVLGNLTQLQELCLYYNKLTSVPYREALPQYRKFKE